MNQKKKVYTCETCNALFSCLKYFHEHTVNHAHADGRIVYPCTHCQRVSTSEHESRLHCMSHQNEPPHMCEVCQEKLGISEEEIRGSRRSIGTVTDFHQTFNISLDGKPMISGEDNDEGDLDEDDDDEEDDDDDEDDDANDDDVEEEADEDDTGELDISTRQVITPQNNNISTSNNNNNNNSSNNNASTKPSRPSRSTGKGKGNRKARFTIDGDFKRKFQCSHCGKSFKTKSHLQRHILTHTGEKPYHCNRCDCRFNQSSSLRNHVIAIHTHEYPHTCSNCGKGFLMPAVLQKHLQTSECGKITNQVVAM